MSQPKTDQNNRFQKQYRLLKASDFSYVFDQAPIRVSHPTLLILAKPSAEAHARLGLVIAKKHAKRAVSRNKIKRLVRESFRNRRKNLPAIDVIVLARKGADNLDNSELLAILDGLWKRVNKKYSKIKNLED